MKTIPKMQFHLLLAVIFNLFALTGCATYQLEPLPVQHPAHPDAMAAVLQPLSDTLAKPKDDLTPTPPAEARRDEPHLAHPSDPGRSGTVVGEGTVITTMPGSGQLVIEHGKIEGFMDAMTMGYRIASPALLIGIESGDIVRFTLDVQRKVIVGIEKLKR